MFMNGKARFANRGDQCPDRKSSGEGRARVQRERSFITTYNEADNLKLLCPDPSKRTI